jgi:hypothetical protein
VFATSSRKVTGWVKAGQQVVVEHRAWVFSAGGFMGLLLLSSGLQDQGR